MSDHTTNGIHACATRDDVRCCCCYAYPDSGHSPERYTEHKRRLNHYCCFGDLIPCPLMCCISYGHNYSSVIFKYIQLSICFTFIQAMIVFGDTYAFRNAVDQDGPNSTLTLGDIMRLGEQQWIVGVLLGACMWTAVCAFTALLRNYILIFGFLYLLLMFYSLIHLFLVVTVSESAYNLIDP